MPYGPLTSLYDRLSRAADKGRGITLTSSDVDHLFAVGAYDVISKAVADALREEAIRRIAEREGGLGDA